MREKKETRWKQSEKEKVKIHKDGEKKEEECRLSVEEQPDSVTEQKKKHIDQIFTAWKQRVK